MSEIAAMGGTVELGEMVEMGGMGERGRLKGPGWMP